MHEDVVHFDSEGVRCAADLYLPGAPEGVRHPAIVLGHGFGLGKAQLVDQGRTFARVGFAALCIDYRFFGASAGEPRGRHFPLDKLEDYRNAISYLQTRPDIDAERIGVWGTSFSGGTVLHCASVDRRVKAVVAQVPVTDGRGWLRMLRNPSQWEELLDRVTEDRLRRYRGEPGAAIPVAGESGEAVLLPWKGPRDASMAPRELVSLESVEKILEYSPLALIEEIAPRPLLIICSGDYDVIHPYGMAAHAYERAREPKRIVTLPFPGMAFYGSPVADVALAHAAEFFREHLGLTLDERRHNAIARAAAAIHTPVAA